MKITGGRAKGILLKVPTGETIRPATDYLRQAVFSSLRELVEGTYFLDLFAGSGAYGLEAWSRGSIGGTFVEKNKLCIPFIKKNLEAVSKSAIKDLTLCNIIQSDVFKTTIPKENQFNLIFADPPYEEVEAMLPKLLNYATAWLKKDTQSRLILEIPGNIALPEHQDLKILKKLGKTKRNSPSVVIWEIK